MLGKKVFAAMLATVLGASLFGANAAKAVINLDPDMEKPAAVTIVCDGDSCGGSTVTDSDGYSVVNGTNVGEHCLNVTGMVGLGGPAGTFVTIRFDLGGMVFSNAIPPTLRSSAMAPAPIPTNSTGGMAGDDRCVISSLPPLEAALKNECRQL